MIDKIGFEVLPNVYFRRIRVETHSTNNENKGKGIYSEMTITGQLYLYDSLLNPTWSRQGSEILSLMSIRLEVRGRGILVEHKTLSSKVEANKEIDFAIHIDADRMKAFYSEDRFNETENNINIQAKCRILGSVLNQKYDLGIKNSDRISGPSSSERLFYYNAYYGYLIRASGQWCIFLYEDGTPVYGPVHQHVAPSAATQEVIMQGSLHRENPHRKVIKVELDGVSPKFSYEHNVSIPIYEGVVKTGINRGGIYTDVVDTEIDRSPMFEGADGNVGSVTIPSVDPFKPLNEETLKLLDPTTIQNIAYTENSTRFNILMSEDIMAVSDKQGTILYKTNPDLFFSLNNKINIKHMSVLRAEINSRVARNRCNVKMTETQTELKYERMFAADFKNNKTEETLTFRDNTHRLRYIQKKSIKKEEDKDYGVHDFTTRDAKQSKLLCSLKPMSIEMPRVKMFQLEDNTIDETSNTKYKYSVEYEIESNIHDMILQHINNLRNTVSEIEGILNRIERKKHFDHRTNRFTKSFLIELHGYYDIVLFEEDRLLRLSANNSSKKLEAYWIQAPYLVSVLTDFSRGKDNETYKEVYRLLSPMMTSPIKMRRAIEIMNKEIKYTIDKYDIRGKEKTGKTVRNNLGKARNRFSIKHDSNKIIHNKKLINNTKFIKNIKKGVLKKSDLIARGKIETNKFFKAIPLPANAKIEFLDDDEKKSLTNITENLTFFTPQIINIGSQKKDLSDNNLDKFNPDFFDKVVDVKLTAPLAFSTPKHNITNLIALQIDEDPNVEDYLGEDTLFKSDNPESVEKFKRLKSFKNSFAKNLNFTKKNKLNIKLFDPDSPKFGLKRFNKKEKKQKLKKLPLSLKSILLGNNDTISRFPIRNGLFDPLKNPETSEATKQNFTRIKKLEYLEGFDSYEGFPVLNKPKWREFDKESLSYSKKIVCRMINYENEDFNIQTDENELPSLDDVFILED